MSDPSSASSRNNNRGIVAMLAAMALFTLNDTLVKLTAEHLPASQIITIRGFSAVVLMIGLLIATGAIRRLSALRQPVVLVRGSMEMIVAGAYVTAIAVLPLATIISILQATPLILTALSAPLLGEKVGWRRWAAVLVGFVGVIMIVRPSLSGVDVAALLALTAAMATATRDLMTRRVAPETPGLVIAFASLVAGLFCGLGLSAFEPWLMPRGADLVALGAAGLALMLANWCMVTACRNVDMSVVSPFRYSVVLWALILGFLVWGDVPDMVALGGTVLIVGSGIYTIHRERVLRRRSRTLAPVAQSSPRTS
jgi:drug/metabolite transporter (DMT)-like permease